MPSQQQIRESITSTIVEALRNGNLPPWRKPWSDDPNCGASANIVSRKNYRGINPMLLQIAAMRHGFQSRWWGTWRQIKEMGGFVRRRPANVPPGAWGTTIIFFKPIVKMVIRDGEETEETFAVMRTYCLFNLDQVQGPFDHLRAGHCKLDPTEIDERCERADQVIAATEAEVRHGGNEAYYSRNHDYIQMPLRRQFRNHEYYETILHELSHWAEHPSRLGHDATDGDKYAFGELVAEISGCYLTSEMGLPVRENMGNHLAYLDNWLKAMENDSRFIFQASSRATKIADYILAFSHKEAEEAEPAIAE